MVNPQTHFGSHRVPLCLLAPPNQSDCRPIPPAIPVTVPGRPSSTCISTVSAGGNWDRRVRTRRPLDQSGDTRLSLNPVPIRLENPWAELDGARRPFLGARQRLDAAQYLRMLNEEAQLQQVEHLLDSLEPRQRMPLD